jgi:hypothetical protein
MSVRGSNGCIGEMCATKRGYAIPCKQDRGALSIRRKNCLTLESLGAMQMNFGRSCLPVGELLAMVTRTRSALEVEGDWRQ